MSPEFPAHLREEPDYVRRPRPWWREAIGSTPLLVVFTVNGLIYGDSTTAWVLLAIAAWAGVAIYAVWLFRCERAGKDPNNTRIGRWADSHKVLYWGALIIFLAMCFAAGQWRIE
jgi:hypothetical protein